MDISEIVTNPTVHALLLALLASEALITFFNDTLAQFAARVPVVGPLLALIVRRATPAFWTWLETQVRDSAERAVREADARTVPGHTDGRTKALLARGVLANAQPGLTPAQVESEIERAYQRVKADAQRAAREVEKAAAKTAERAAWEAKKAANRNGQAVTP